MKKTKSKFLVPQCLSALAPSKKSAFTLAEVLITLAIIGVVAAMTIPTLISDYQERVTVTKVKKAYSTLTNAYSMFLAENGEPPRFHYDEQGAIDAAEVFKKYLKIAKDCGTSTSEGCLYSGQYMLKNDVLNEAIYSTDTSYYKLRLADGASIWIRGAIDSETAIGIATALFYDVNGEAPPNKWGHDLFHFKAYINRGLLPVGIIASDLFDDACAPADSKGYGCTAWVVQKGNLDYLKCPGELTWKDRKCPN